MHYFQDQVTTDPPGGLSVVILQGVGDWIRAC